MKYWVISWSLMLGLLSTVKSQEVPITLLKSIKANFSMIEVDNIGNIYLVKGGAISKYDLSGQLKEKNSAMAFGDIYTLDASNALKMLVFFKDLSQITYVDNQLASRGDNVALDEMGYNQITAICRSYNEGIWIYDQTTFELLRLNEQLESIVQSGNLTQLLDFVPEPNYMRENNNWLYVNDPTEGILIFDWYGSYTKKIPVTDLTKFVVRADRVFYIKDGFLQYYHLKSNEYAKIKLSVEDWVDFTVFEDKLLLITQNELFIYRINVN